MKSFFNFLIGFISSMFIVTIGDVETMNGNGLMPLVKYIGPCILFGIIFLNNIKAYDHINELENKIKEMDDAISNIGNRVFSEDKNALLDWIETQKYIEKNYG